MTTSTVALPGVSSLTRGVSTVPPASLTLLSISGNCRSHFCRELIVVVDILSTSALGQEKAMRPKASAWSIGSANCTSSNIACHRDSNYHVKSKDCVCVCVCVCVLIIIATCFSENVRVALSLD